MSVKQQALLVLAITILFVKLVLAYLPDERLCTNIILR